MILEGLLTILQSLVGWLFLIIFQMLLRIVDILEKFFDVFAGTAPVYYKGKENYLFDLFLSNQAITNLFWAIAIIAIVISFGFCIVAVARKVTDVSGTSKHTIGQIMSNFIRSLLVILLLNLCVTAAFKVTSVIFDRINYSLEHAETLRGEQEKTYTEEEFATMVRILATMGNYAANPSAESRYNVNACFNAIRGELITLYETGCFNYDFPVVQTGKHTWQSALAQVAKSANLNEDLQLDTYYPTVQEAITLCFNELKTNSTFKPQETAVRGTTITDKMTTAMMIFLVSSMGAEENEQFINGGFDDALRRSYINGEKDFLSFGDVYEDFAITQINYLIGIIAALACILFLAKVILMFIVRMLNLILLYVVSPLFASSMSLDEGSRFQNWTQSFVMQLLSAYASVVMMRIYLLVVPIVVNSDLKFFEPGTYASHLTIYGQLLFVLAGAWAVSRATNLISGALTGHAAGSLQESDSAFGHMVSWAVGTDRLWSELGRRRMNRDRARSSQKGHEKANETKQKQQEQKQQLAAQRNRVPAVKDDAGIASGEKSSMDALRQQYDMSNDLKIKNQSKEADDAYSKKTNAGLSNLRSQMGLDAPNMSVNDNFDVDSLTDIGKKSSYRKNNQTGNGPVVPNTTVPPNTTISSNPTGTNTTTNNPIGTNTSTNNSNIQGTNVNITGVNNRSRRPSVNANPVTGNTTTQGKKGNTGDTGLAGANGTNGTNGTNVNGLNTARNRQTTTQTTSSANMRSNLLNKINERNDNH